MGKFNLTESKEQLVSLKKRLEVLETQHLPTAVEFDKTAGITDEADVASMVGAMKRQQTAIVTEIAAIQAEMDKNVAEVYCGNFHEMLAGQLEGVFDAVGLPKDDVHFACLVSFDVKDGKRSLTVSTTRRKAKGGNGGSKGGKYTYSATYNGKEYTATSAAQLLRDLVAVDPDAFTIPESSFSANARLGNYLKSVEGLTAYGREEIVEPKAEKAKASK